MYHNKEISYPKLIYIFTQFSIIMPTGLFEELDKMMRKFYIIKIQDRSTSFLQKNIVERDVLLQSGTYFWNVIIKQCGPGISKDKIIGRM